MKLIFCSLNHCKLIFCPVLSFKFFFVYNCIMLPVKKRMLNTLLYPDKLARERKKQKTLSYHIKPLLHILEFICTEKWILCIRQRNTSRHSFLFLSLHKQTAFNRIVGLCPCFFLFFFFKFWKEPVLTF